MSNSGQYENIPRAAQAIAECRRIATFSEDPHQITRRYLTPPVADVHAYLRNRMQTLGMSVHTDAAGNLRGLWTPESTSSGSSKRLLIGSHIDTVPNAGAFDGVLGVILALHLVEQARAESLPLAIEVIAFSEEEGVRFGVPFLGSRAVAGRFDPALLDLPELLAREGVSVREAMTNFGLDPESIDQAIASQDAIAYLELHIEQGPVLESENLSLGVVTAIVGQTRYELSFTGHANHAGTTPMHLRHDALAAAAEWIMAVESTARSSSPPQASLVATVGKLRVEPNAGNVIPGTVQVSLDVRADRDSIREAAVDDLLTRATSIAERRGLQCESKVRMTQPAVPMDEQLTALLAEAVEATGHPPRHLPSGAGHDAMVIATRIPTAMLFLRSPGGISHHPDETVREEDVEAALQAAEVFLRRLAATYAP